MEIDANVLIEGTDIDMLCRSCLTHSDIMYLLTDSIEIKIKCQEESKTIQNLLENVTCSQVIDDEKYPKKICHMCMSLLKLSYQFKLEFENSQEILTEIVGNFLTKKSSDNIKKTVPVELIFGENKYDLKDIVIIEDKQSPEASYEGFLNNLGTEISATFVDKQNNLNKVKELIKNNKEVVVINKSREIHTENTHCDEENIVTQFQCDSCKKLFISKIKLKQHIKLVHRKKLKHFCPICGHVSDTISAKRYHQLKHEAKRFNCNKCNKSYTTRTSLNVHLEVHKNERKFLCNICGKRFNYKNALTYHMRIHTGEKMYVCDFCGIEFSMPCTLKRHLRTHTKVRPYQCHYCEKCFKSKGEVNLHEMLHTGYRPYHCKYCGKGFTKTYNLEMHYLSHKGPHKCHVCPRNFVDIKYLKIHLSNTHNLIVDLAES